jgi:uncharacterized protein (TIGR03083 family)
VLLTPRYDGVPVLRLDGPAGDPAVPLVRQRRRLATWLAGIDDDKWDAPTRCERWSVKDVICHLVTTNQFWAISFTAALKGEPTRFLGAFDPVASPEEMVDAVRGVAAGDVLARFVDTNDALEAAVDAVGENGWAVTGEAPPGHVALHAVAMHALWDGWVHERDVMLPFGTAPAEEPDEITGCLRYVAALGPAFAIAGGSLRSGAIEVVVTDPDDRFVVDVGETVVVRDGEAPDGALRLTGTAVDLLEALSFRGPLECTVAADDRWLLMGIAEVFDRTP